MPKRDRNAKRRQEELQKSAAKLLDTIFRRSLNDSLPEIPTMPPGNYDPSAAITSDDIPKDKVYHQSEVLPSSCSRPITSSSSSHDPSTAITPDHTPGDKDHHLTQTLGNRQSNFTPETVNFPHPNVHRNSFNYCRCCQQIPRASLIFGREMWPNKGSHSMHNMSGV